MAFNAERRKAARGDDGYLSIEYGLWRRKFLNTVCGGASSFEIGARCFATV